MSGGLVVRDGGYGRVVARSRRRAHEVDAGLRLKQIVVLHAVGLAFARERYQPRRVYLHVAEFNERARRIYERAGFVVVSRHARSFERFGEVPFLTMAEDVGA